MTKSGLAYINCV